MRWLTLCLFCFIAGGFLGTMTTDKEIEAAKDAGRLEIYNDAMREGHGHWNVDEDPNTSNEFLWNYDRGRPDQSEATRRGIRSTPVSE